MIEATCTACGTVNRIADADVPTGAKFVTCASCKARVAIARPAVADGGFDVADLPAPRRHGALGGDAARATPSSGMAAADPRLELEPELPAPRTKRVSTSPHNVPAGTSLELDELLGTDAPLDVTDLPAPRAKQAPHGELPMPRPKPSVVELGPPGAKPPALGDLPAPRPVLGRAMTDLPGAEPTPPAMPALRQAALDDLPAPRSAAPPPSDLPAPRSVAPPPSDLPAPRSVAPSPSDLPAPRTVAPPPIDLPAPAVTLGLPDLPAPRPRPGLADLPAPRPKAGAGEGIGARRTPPIGVPAIKPPSGAPAPGAIKPPSGAPAPAMTLPASGALKPPARPAGIVDLPAPTAPSTELQPRAGDVVPAAKPGSELLAPKGFFDDLPQPAAAGRQAQASTDVAPKGFFDDLPQPAAPARQAGASTDVAPQGFFDDLPQPAGATRQTGASTDIAPQGFFDDLPGRPTGKPGTDVVPQGFFDDLPRRAPTTPRAPGTDVAPQGFFDDLPARPTSAPSTDVAPKGAAAPAVADSLELEPMEGSQPGIELDLGAAIELEDTQAAPAAPRTKAPSVMPAPAPDAGSQFDDLDLSTPSPVRFEKKPPGTPVGPPPASVASLRTPLPPVSARGGEIALELEEPREASTFGTKLAPKPTAAAPAAGAGPAPAKRRTKLAAIAAVGVLALGGGGFYVYQRHAKAEAHAAAVSEQVAAARRALAQGQWARANLAAQQTLELEASHGEALGIAAEAQFATGLHDGAAGSIANGRKLLARALEANVQHPALERAQALSPLAANQPDKAIPKLQALATRAPTDGALALYLGWAHAARGDYAAALKAYDQAAATPAVKVPALFARARAKQAQGDLDGARADYAAVLEVAKDNIPAQVGLAAALPAGQAPQQEADLLAILALKDIEKRDPRAATQAWALAADAARRSGRLEVARERYRKALAITAQDIEALIGLGEVELRDGKLDLAADAIGKVLQQAPDNMRAQLAATEIAIAQNKLDDAALRIEALTKRTPPPPAVEQARLKMLAGHLAEVQGQEDVAIATYLEAARIAGDLDLTPTLKAASKLNELAAKTTEPARANELRAQADQLLATLADNAQKDPQLALTLGMAYVQAGEAAKAEPWLRRVIAQRPKDVDAQHQLAKALALLGKPEEAIDRLRVALQLDPARVDIGLELARTYEGLGRKDDAARLYDKLLATENPPLVLRERAGRFFARTDQMEKAGEQGTKILEVNPDHPAGLYLKGEGALRAGKTDEARKLFTLAADSGREAQYFDALGRAAEKWAIESGDSKYQETALRAYTQATELDATLHASLVGLGRLYVRRGEDAKAIEPLAAASKLKLTAEVARLMGIAYKNLAQPKLALQWLEESSRIEKHAETSWMLGQVYNSAQINNPRAAAAAFATATRLAEDHERNTDTVVPWLTEALYEEGNVNRALGRDAETRRAWEKHVARKPAPGARLKEVTYFLATTLQR